MPTISSSVVADVDPPYRSGIGLFDSHLSSFRVTARMIVGNIVCGLLEKVQKLALKFVKGLRHVPYEAALIQLRIFSLTHRRIRGDLIAMFKITHGLLEFPMETTFVYPTRQVPPTAMLYAPSPIRLRHSGSPILEQTAG